MPFKRNLSDTSKSCPNCGSELKEDHHDRLCCPNTGCDQLMVVREGSDHESGGDGLPSFNRPD
jgi:ribosomal protein S27AE